MRGVDPVLRFVRSIERIGDGGCWEWTGGKLKGYGRLKVNGKMERAHRFSYEVFIGPIPTGYVLDHAACDNPGCVRPDHLEPVLNGENVRRGTSFSSANRLKTTCPRGHLYDARNSVGARYCYACDRARQAIYRQRCRQERGVV